MTHGPGRYDDEVKRILMRDQAVAVAIIVLGGVRNSGTGMKVAGASPELARDMMRTMAQIMRKVADFIEKDAADPTLKADE